MSVSDAKPLITFITLSLIFGFFVTPLILWVAPETSQNNLTGIFNSTNNLIYANVSVGFGWFDSDINLIPFESLREFLSDQVTAWSYIPSGLAFILAGGLLVGALYAFIKALPTT